MALIDDLNTVTVKLNDDADALASLVPQLQTQVADLQAQLAAGLSQAEGTALLADLNAVESKFRALYP